MPAIHYIFLFLHYYAHIVTDLIKKLELCLLQIEFEHNQISEAKIGISMLKTACINPCCNTMQYIL